MLILSRHKDESILVNPGTPDEVEIMVIEIRGDKVRLGVRARRDIVVHRKEIAELIAAQNERANES